LLTKAPIQFHVQQIELDRSPQRKSRTVAGQADCSNGGLNSGADATQGSGAAGLFAAKWSGFLPMVPSQQARED